MFDYIAPYQRRFIWNLLLLGGIEATHKEVRDGRYNDGKPINLPDSPKYDGSKAMFDVAKAIYGESLDRKETLDKKVTSLMSLTGILLPLTITFFVYASDWAVVGWFFIIPFFIVTGLLLFCALLLLEFLRLNRFSQPGMDEKLVESTEANREILIIRDYLKAASYNEDTNRYLADVYRAARRFFICALIISTAVGWIAAGTKTFLTERNPEKRLLKTLKDDPELVSLLRGTDGPPGQTGQQGPPGPRGDVGPPASPPLDTKNISTRNQKP
jgi:hypothetical protein